MTQQLFSRSALMNTWNPKTTSFFNVRSVNRRKRRKWHGLFFTAEPFRHGCHILEEDRGYVSNITETVNEKGFIVTDYQYDVNARSDVDFLLETMGY